MKKLLFILLMSLPLLSATLQLQNGSISAHTEMLMDSTIDPINTELQAELSMQDRDIVTLNGKFWVETALFISDKSDRDESMYEEMEVDKYKLATYTISSVTKTEQIDVYTIDGVLDFHGQKKQLSANATIKTLNGSLTINATSKILVSDFGIEMPCMVFMCVRDQVDLKIEALFN